MRGAVAPTLTLPRPDGGGDARRPLLLPRH